MSQREMRILVPWSFCHARRLKRTFSSGGTACLQSIGGKMAIPHLLILMKRDCAPSTTGLYTSSTGPLSITHSIRILPETPCLGNLNRPLARLRRRNQTGSGSMVAWRLLECRRQIQAKQRFCDLRASAFRPLCGAQSPLTGFRNALS